MFKNSVFAFVLLTVLFNAYGLEPKLIAENKFANIVLKSSSLIEDNPQRTLLCFANYVERLNELTDQYEAEFGMCLQRATDARAVIEEEVQGDRNDLENSAIQICGGFQNCSTESKSTYDFFECYGIVAGETTRTAFNIQNIANGRMEYMRMRYITIDFDQNRCTDETTRVYIEDTASIFNELERCLAGESIATPTTTTMTPTTIGSTTESITTDSTTIESTTTDSTTTAIPTPPGGFEI